MNGLNLNMPEAAVVKIKYEMSLFNLQSRKSALLIRYVVKSTGDVAITKMVENAPGEKEVRKFRLDPLKVQEMFQKVIICIYSDSAEVDYPVDDIGRRMYLSFENGSVRKLDGVYSCGNMNTEQLITELSTYRLPGQ